LVSLALPALAFNPGASQMENKIEDFLLSCSEIDFGTVSLSDEEKDFCKELNNEVISLCKSLPEPTQTQALFLLLRYFRIPFGQEFSFFMNYYAPAWSIIYWLIQACPERKGLKQKDINKAKTAHSMALLLHPFDDHLNDKELPATHLTLLLRSQLWMIMNNALSSLAGAVDGGPQIVEGFFDDYYSSITNLQEILSLDSYCDGFRKQMATGFIAPVLIMKKMSAHEEFTHAVQSAYASFGIAWRLLDDINDIKTDIMNGRQSAIYACLPEDVKYQWNKDTEDKSSGGPQIILEYVLKNSIIDKIKEKMSAELKLAAAAADNYNMKGLAAEFRSLLSPLNNRQNHS
jgi:hypothetical protein